MRIRRTILAPAILAIGTAGTLIAVPAFAVAVAAPSPSYMGYHASGLPAPDVMGYHG